MLTSDEARRKLAKEFTEDPSVLDYFDADVAALSALCQEGSQRILAKMAYFCGGHRAAEERIERALSDAIGSLYGDTLRVAIMNKLRAALREDESSQP